MSCVPWVEGGWYLHDDCTLGIGLSQSEPHTNHNNENNLYIPVTCVYMKQYVVHVLFMCVYVHVCQVHHRQCNEVVNSHHMYMYAYSIIEFSLFFQ